MKNFNSKKNLVTNLAKLVLKIFINIYDSAMYLKFISLLIINRQCLGIFYNKYENNLQLWMLYILRSENSRCFINVIQKKKI